LLCCCGPATRPATRRGRLLGLTMRPAPTPIPPRPCPPAFINTDFMEDILSGYGVPFDVVRINTTGAARTDYKTLLWNADGSSKYSSIVM
jgi:hypothetical protein